MKSHLNSKRKNWWIVPADFLHVAPSGDERVHVARADCWCAPTLDSDSGWLVHHALDGRVWETDGQIHGFNPWLETNPP